MATAKKHKERSRRSNAQTQSNKNSGFNIILWHNRKANKSIK